MLDMIYVQNEGLITRNIAGETLIVPLRNRVGDLDAIFTLNETGVRVWALLDGQTNVAQIAETISQEYEIDTESARHDVAELLGDLATAGLVRQV
jgi:hypothetical protein